MLRQDEEYVALPVDADGIMRSRIFPGLWLAVDDLLTGNMTRVLAGVQAGLASSDHARFVQQLGAAYDASANTPGGP